MANVNSPSVAGMSFIVSKIGFSCLWLLVTISALLVIWATHETRTLVNQLLSMRSEANVLLVEHGQLQLQERSLSSAAEVELVAVSELGLKFPSDQEIEVLLP